MLRLIIIIIITLCNTGFSFSQKTAIIDSLEQALLTAKEDSGKVKLLNLLGRQYMNYDLEKVKRYSGEGLKLALKLNHLRGQVDSYNNLGNTAYLRGEYPDALDNYLKGLKVMEQIGDKHGIANSLMGVGNVYTVQKDHQLALEYQERSLELRKEIGDEMGMAACYNNIGIIYLEMEDVYAALEYQLKGLKIKEKLGVRKEMSSSYGNIGNLYIRLENYQKALEYLHKANEIRKELNNKKGMSMTHMDLSQVYEKQGDYQKARMHIEKALELGREVGYNESIRNAYANLSALYEKQGDLKQALEYYKQYSLEKDSIFNAGKASKIAEMRTRFETEKKEQEIQLLKKDQSLKEEELARKRAEIAKRKTVLYATAFGLVLVIILVFVIYNRYRLKQKANQLLEAQNEKIAEKNQHITDSIEYAKKIQEAILPKPEYLDSLFPEYFVLYQPKDLVSGDFYWSYEKGNKVVFTVADCTGHGVPGAFMSMIGNSLLNEIVIEKGILRADEILNELRRQIIYALKQRGQEEDSRDGMDMALCIWHKDTGMLEFAGANNPLYILRENNANDFELLTFEPDAAPIAYHYGKEKVFTRHDITLQKGDTLYLFSDGYTDQFGGEKSKKFKIKPFKELLIRSAQQDMPAQKMILHDTIEQWRGSLEQIDDICVMGVRIT